MQSPIEQRRVECDNLIHNIGISFETIRQIETELKEHPGDVISLVFLLSSTPDIAFHRLSTFQAPSYQTTTSPFLEWYYSAKSRSTWKQELLECLLICQLYSVVRKIGFPVTTMKKYIQPDNLEFSMYVDPIKKILYKLCEYMNKDNLIKLIKSLETYGIHVAPEKCELILLQLMTKNFITIQDYHYDRTMLGCSYQLENLARIIEKLPGLQTFASTLVSVQNRMNVDLNLDSLVVTSTPKHDPPKVDVSTQKSDNSMDEVFELLNQLSIEDHSSDKLKTDRNDKK